MNEESELTDEILENDSMKNPIRQNHDYGGNFLDKIRERNERREQRKEAMSKFAQEKAEFKPGDQVKVIRDDPWPPIDAVVLSVSQRDEDGNPTFYFLRFQYEGSWRKHTAEAARVVANPDGRVPLSDGSPDEQEAPESIQKEVSSTHEDTSLKPVYSDNHDYFIFPDYEFGLYSASNDALVKDLNGKYTYGLGNSLEKYKDQDLIPVIRDAAVLALNNKQPDRLLNIGLYDFIKENYPKYWTSAINSVVIQGRRLHAIPDGKYEEVYDAFKEQILPVIFSYDKHEFVQLFFKSRTSSRDGGSFGFLLERLLYDEAPEFKEYLKANIDKLSGPFIFRAHLYSIFPEETKEKILKYLEDYSKDKPGRIMEVSHYVPEAKEFLRKTLESNFSKIFQGSARDFIETFSPEERQTFYPLLLKNKPSSVFHAIHYADSTSRYKEEARAAADQVVREVPQDIWDKMALKSFEENPSYFFTIEAMDFIPFSENVIKIGYDHVLNNIKDIKYDLRSLFKNEKLNDLMKEYGVTHEQFLNIYKHFNGEELSKAHALSSVLQRYTSTVAQKVQENQELSESDNDFIFKYFDDELYKATPGQYQELNTLLTTEEAKKWANKSNSRRGLNNGPALFSHIHKAEEPFLSETAFYNLMHIANGRNLLQNNYGPDKAFTDWMPMSKLIGEPSEELLRFYSEMMVTEKPRHLFKSSGKSKVNLFTYFADQDLEDEEIFEQIYGISPELIKEIKENNPEGFREAVKKSREKAKQEREKAGRGEIPLIQRFPDLLIPAIQNMEFSPFLLDTELIRYLQLIYPKLNEIPESIADIIYTKVLQKNATIKTLYSDEYKLINTLKELFPQKHDIAVRKTARMMPAFFLNSSLGRNRAQYEQEIFAAIGDLNRRAFEGWGPSGDYLSDEFKEFVYQPANQDIMKALIDRAVEINETEELMYMWPDLAVKAKDLGVKMLPVAALRNVEDLETAKGMYQALRNDYPVEGLPEEIKISRSIYQSEQRPYILEDETRYTISNNNIDPTPVLYDIGKKLVHAGDGVAHTNVGVSGFTNSWALVSFIKVQEDMDSDNFEKTILIEQYQSDYPPVLFHLFSGQGSSEYGTGKDALQRLIQQYGDQEAIQKYKEEMTNLGKENIPKKKLDVWLDSFDWTNRTANNLARAGFSRVRQLLDYSKNDLLRTGLFGRKSVTEIEEVMKENGTPLKSDELEVGERVRVSDRHPSNYAGAIGVIKRVRENAPEGDNEKYSVSFGDNDIEFFERKHLKRISLTAEEMELPIELAPMVKDARTHFEYIAKAYPYLAIANTIKTAQALNMKNIYIFADAAGYANIENDDKAYKLYEAIPAALGELIHDHNYDLKMWKIPATDETLEKLNAMNQEATGKDRDYNFSLTPAQNQEIEQKRLQEERKKKQQWSATPEKQKKLNNLEMKIRDMLPEMEVPNFYSPQQALRFLGQEVKGKAVPKKRFNRQFGKLMKDLGMLARASRRRRRMIKIATFLRKYASDWKDGTPTFKWLENGLIGKLKNTAPKAFDEFIDLNSDKFVEWEPVKYLGSGMVGDAWLLADDRILKIYDDNALVFNKTDSQKYEEIMSAQHDGSADTSLPMIYEYGRLEMPAGFYNVRSPSRKNWGGHFRPGYVILERLDTPQQLAKKYTDYNPYLLEPGFVYDEDADEWIEREYIEGEEVPFISEDEVPLILLNDYHESIKEGTYDQFLQTFVSLMFNYIIADMYFVYEQNKEAFDSEIEELNEGDDLPDDILDFRDSDIAHQLKEEMVDRIEYSDSYNDINLGALKRILNLPNDWDQQLAKAVTNNALRGRHDLHGGNFGFRNGQAVFFDA